MAIPLLKVKHGGRGKAMLHCLYVTRLERYADIKSDEVLEMSGHGNMPAWAEKNPKLFWQEADNRERKNGSTYREHIGAIPRELDEAQRAEFVQAWLKNEFGEDFVYSYGVHNLKAMDGLPQPHIHVMFCERKLDGIERDPEQFFKRYNSKNPERGGAKKMNTGLTHAERKEQILAVRQRWGDLVNQHLELAGRPERINMKSLKAQGIDREPINISMADMQKPEIRKAYKADLLARRDLEKLEKNRLEPILIERRNALDITNLKYQFKQSKAKKDEDELEQLRAMWKAEQDKPQQSPPPSPLDDIAEMRAMWKAEQSKPKPEPTPEPTQPKPSDEPTPPPTPPKRGLKL